MKHTGFLMGCLIVITASALQALPQSLNRTRAGGPQLVTEPIKITTPAIKIRSARGWLTQPLVQVENVSNKPIEYLAIELKLPGAKELFMLAYGQQPGKPATNTVRPLPPGGKLDLSVDQHACDVTQKRLLEIDPRSLAGNHATAKINGIVFNDQTAWFDGLPHVVDPNNPLRWNVVRSTSMNPNDSAVFSFLKVGFRENNNAGSNYELCWDRIGTEWVDCCGLQRSSAVMVQVFGGIYEPIEMVSECCTWIKQSGCSNPPW